jgi:hypothetical protein
VYKKLSVFTLIVFGIFSGAHSLPPYNFSDESGSFWLAYDSCESAGYLACLGAYAPRCIATSVDANSGAIPRSGNRALYDFCYDQANDKYLREWSGCNVGTPNRQAYFIQSVCSTSGAGNPPDINNSAGCGQQCWCRAMDAYGNMGEWQFANDYGSANGCQSGAWACYNRCNVHMWQRRADAAGNYSPSGIYGGNQFYDDDLTNGTLGYRVLHSLHQYNNGAGRPYKPGMSNLFGCASGSYVATGVPD